jgi:hypothetical protein
MTDTELIGGQEPVSSQPVAAAPTEQSHDERVLFETWFTSWADPHVGAVEHVIKRQAAREAWQARAALQQRQAPAQAENLEDIVNELREFAGNPGYSHGDYADTMRKAANSIEMLRARFWTHVAQAEAAPAPAEPVATDEQQDQSARLAAAPASRHVISLGDFGLLQSEDRTTGERGWLLYDNTGKLVRALNPAECELVIRSWQDGWMVGMSDYAKIMAEEPPTIPEGFALVPLNYTREMRAAWDNAPFDEDEGREFANAYRLMVEAAPAPVRERAPAELDALARRLRDYARHNTQMDKDMIAAAQIIQFGKEF